MAMEVVIVGERIEELIAAGASLRGTASTVTLAQTRDVLRRAKAVPSRAGGGLVVFLTERDNLAELRAVLGSTARSVLLVAPTSPPHAPLARLAAEFCAGLFGRHDPWVVREVFLVAMAARAPERAVS